MSCDAKAWLDVDGWHAIHDGKCSGASAVSHNGDSYDLIDVLSGVEECMGRPLQWGIRVYINGDVGLVGYESARGVVA